MLSTFVPLMGDRVALRSFCERKNGGGSQKDLLIQKLKAKYSSRNPDEFVPEMKRRNLHGNANNGNALKTSRTVLLSWKQKTKTGLTEC
jgi:hypothetical protein